MASTICNCGCKNAVNRRDALAALVCVGFVGAVSAVAPASAEAALAPRQSQDEGFMRLALAEAAKGDFPFGAVIARDGKVVATGHNMTKKTKDPTAHGEMAAIRHFVSRHPAAELKTATLYTTGEPCPMCMSAILWCGFARMVYAASIEQLSTRIGQIMLTSESVGQAAPFARIEITGGVLAAEAMALFR